MKMNRGVSAEFTSKIQGVEYKDNKVENLVSAFVGVKPLLAEYGVAVDVPTTEQEEPQNYHHSLSPKNKGI